VRTFRDPRDLNATGLIVEIPDMEKFQQMLQSPEGAAAMKEDGLRVEYDADARRVRALTPVQRQSERLRW
jgi:hypothetical protein